MSNEAHKIPWPNWETIRLIGRGSFGAVYEIQRDLYGKTEQAAMKVISIPENNEEIDELYSEGYDAESVTTHFKNHLESIIREYTVMLDLKGNTNVVYCDDLQCVQHDDGIGWDIFIKMELLTPLTKAIGKEIREDQAIRLGKDMCSALVLCKNHNIVHRDIKPQNIFVSKEGHYKLGDFGIARTMERTTGATVRIGTYEYMAPEVYRGQPYGASADIYSLGLVLYWMLNDKRGPFLPQNSGIPTAGEKESARQRRFEGEALPAPIHGSDALQRIVLKACAYDPKDRYSSAAEMLKDLNCLGNTTTTAAITGTVAVAPSVEPEENQENEPEGGTVGLFWATSTKGLDTEPESQPADEDTEGTVGAFDQITSHAKQSDAQKTLEKEAIDELLINVTAKMPKDAALINFSAIDRPVERKGKGGKVPWIWVVLGVIGVIVCIFLMLRGCTPAEEPEKTPQSDPGTVEESNPGTVEDKHPLQTDWSGWADALPDYVTADKYDIEEQILYRGRQLEITASTETNTLDGWELYDTVSGNGGYGAWSQWSTQAVSGSETRQVETQKLYRYRTKETCTDSAATKSGWELYNTTYALGDYGAWADWTTTSVASSDSRQVETKTQYSTRSKIVTQQYSAWSDWSGWSTTRQTTSDLKTEESRTTWAYYYYECANCGAHMHGWGECYTWANGCGIKSSREQWTWHQIYSRIAWENADLKEFHGTGKYFSYMPIGELVFKHESGGTRPEYRYATRTLDNVVSYGEWSSYVDTAYSESSTLEVRTRTVYRYRDRQQIPSYHFWRWGNWSDWSTAVATATSECQVEEVTNYRYRDLVTATTYYFRRWTDWSDYGVEVISASDTINVETKTQYRFKSKNE